MSAQRSKTENARAAKRRAAAALLAVGADVPPEIEEAFHVWWATRIRAARARPGVNLARTYKKDHRWPGVGESPGYLTLYELEDADGFVSDAGADSDAFVESHSESGLRLTRSTYRELTPTEDARIATRGSGILFVHVDVSPAHNDRFLGWYVDKHVPAVLEAPGMLSARRFEYLRLDSGGRAPTGQHRYCTVYEMENARVISRPETIEAASRGACPPELQPYRAAFNHVYEEIVLEVPEA